MEIDYTGIKVIGFDADDTLWVNETYFREAEMQFAKLLAPYETANTIDQELFRTEIANLEFYGYGIKSFVLSMVECGLKLSNYTLSNEAVSKMLEIGKDMLNKPVELLEGVEETLKSLSGDFKLILVTKGDLLDQERKLEKSNLASYFHHIEVVSDKQPSNYKKLLDHLEINPEEFLMIGNSLKSDVLPLIQLGSKAVHIPFHTTWIHEQVEDHNPKDYPYETMSSLLEIKQKLKPR